MRYPRLLSVLTLLITFSAFGSEVTKTRISKEGHWAVIGSWDTPPDSPDGSKLVYLRLLERPTRYNEQLPGEIWVCNADGTGHYRLAENLRTGPHDGASQRFLTNDRILYSHSDQTMKIVDLEGNLIASCPGLSKHDNVNNRFYARGGRGKPIVTYDYEGNHKGIIVRPHDFFEYKDEMAGSDTPNRWAFRHIHISPNGEYLMAQIDTGKQPWYLVTFKNDGSDKAFFGKKPIHCTWWDNERIVAGDGMIYDRYNNKIGIACGPGNHATFSPDRSYVANDVDYHDSPVRLTLYATGEDTGILIDEHKHTQTVWDHKVHINPAFSHDGTRLYWNRAVNEDIVEVWWTPMPR